MNPIYTNAIGKGGLHGAALWALAQIASVPGAIIGAQNATNDAQRAAEEASRLADAKNRALAAKNGRVYQETDAARAQRLADESLSLGGGSQYADTSVARSLIQSQLDSLGGLEASQNQAAQRSYDDLLQQYALEDQRAQQSYDTQMQSATDARSKGTQGALVSAAQGARGLRGVLGSLGALSGTGVDLANRAVAQAANTDLGNVNENYTTNATNLNTAFSQTKTDQEKRRQQADSALQDARIKNAADIATKRADLIGQMAEKYSSAGMNSQATSTANSIKGLYDTINRGAAVSAPSWNPMTAAFNPAALQQYLGGGYDQSVQASGQSPSNLAVNTPLFTQTKRRDQALA